MLNWLYALDPTLALVFPRSSHSATADLEQENNQATSDKPQVSQPDPPATGLHNRSLEQGRENRANHMGVNR
jgi:hypothetical protein